MSTLTNSQKHIAGVATPKLWWIALAAGAAAFIGNLIVFFIAQNLLGVSPAVPQFPDNTTLVPLSIGQLLAASIVPALAAAVLLAILGRFVKRPFPLFQIIAAIILLLSFGGPLTLPLGGAEKAVLAVMHLVTAVAIVAIFSALARKP
jgi:hypothetical protein